MDTNGISYIAWWGAGLSTLLAFIKLREVWLDRFRVDIGYNCSDIDNKIYIRNLTGRPIIISYWELLYGSGIWPFRKFSTFESPAADASDIKIESHSSKTFTFSGADYFGWSEKALNGRKIYIRLDIAGRRPFLKKVYE